MSLYWQTKVKKWNKIIQLNKNSFKDVQIGRVIYLKTFYIKIKNLGLAVK